MKRILTGCALAMALVFVSTAPADAQTRFGIGLGLDGVSGRVEIQRDNIIDVFVDFDTLIHGGSGVGDRSTTGYKFGGMYQRRLIDTDPVTFNVLGGLSLTGQSESRITLSGGQTPEEIEVSTSQTAFGLFGGVGAEYFFPNTKRFSLSVNTGLTLGLHSISSHSRQGATITTVSRSSTSVGLGSVGAGALVFHYYFADR